MHGRCLGVCVRMAWLCVLTVRAIGSFEASARADAWVSETQPVSGDTLGGSSCGGALAPRSAFRHGYERERGGLLKLSAGSWSRVRCGGPEWVGQGEAGRSVVTLLPDTAGAVCCTKRVSADGGVAGGDQVLGRRGASCGPGRPHADAGILLGTPPTTWEGGCVATCQQSALERGWCGAIEVRAVRCDRGGSKRLSTDRGGQRGIKANNRSEQARDRGRHGSGPGGETRDRGCRGCARRRGDLLELPALVCGCGPVRRAPAGSGRGSGAVWRGVAHGHGGCS